MKRALLTLSTLMVTTALGQLTAQEQQFETVMTPAFSPITWERLVDAGQEPENWLMYSGTLDSQRYSLLDDITDDITLPKFRLA